MPKINEFVLSNRARDALQGLEGFGRETGLLEQAHQETALHLAGVDGNDETDSGRVIQHRVTSGLMIDLIADAAKLADELPWLDAAETGHQAGREIETDSTSSFPRTGNDSPRFLRLAQYARMASLTISSASSKVSPWVTQPGKEGTRAMNPPSSADSKTTVRRTVLDATGSV